MVPIFWLSLATIAYVYAGYPLLLAAWARLRPRPIGAVRRNGDNRGDAGTQARPGISIIIAARNEGHRLAARIQNLLDLDYPAGGRQIIVVSDGSTDDTASRLAGYPAVETISVPAGGKALALNAGIERARFDVLVFGDARQTFASDTLLELTAPFDDSTIGAVTGELILESEAGRRVTTAERRVRTDGLPVDNVNRRIGPNQDRRQPTHSTIGDGVGLYWRYEKQLRRLESTIDSTLGATGAVYAMRRSLWAPLPADTLLDDVLAPMRCVLSGYRVVFNPLARAFDRASADAHAEGRRKLRTLAGNYQILWLEPRLLLPWRNRVWLQYVSHKIGRLVVPYALLAFFAASVGLAGRSTAYAAVLAAQ
jgi:poly-beta-1,6-N-acetyl-D-glucosamine synthase